MLRLPLAFLLLVATTTIVSPARATDPCDSSCYSSETASFLPGSDDIAPLNTRVFADTSEATGIRELNGEPVDIETIDLDGTARYLVPTADLAPETVYQVISDTGKQLSRFTTGTARDDEAPTGDLTVKLYGSCGTVLDIEASFTNEGTEEAIVIEIRAQGSDELMAVLPERQNSGTGDRWMLGCIWTDAESLSLVATAYDLAGNALSIDKQWEAKEETGSGCHLAQEPGRARGPSSWLLLTLAAGSLAAARRRSRDRAC